MVGQKFRACVLLNLAPDAILGNMAQVLVTQGHPGPLYPSLGLLLPLLDDKTRKKMAKTIASDLLCNGPWCLVLKQPLELSSDKFLGKIALEIISGMKAKR